MVRADCVCIPLGANMGTAVIDKVYFGKKNMGKKRGKKERSQRHA